MDVDVDLDDPRRNGTLDPFELTIEPRDVQVLDLTAQGTVPDVGFSVTARSVNGQPVYAELTYDGGSPSEDKGLAATPGAPAAATLVALRRRGERGLHDRTGQRPQPRRHHRHPHRRAAPPERPQQGRRLTGTRVAPGSGPCSSLPKAGAGDLVLLVSADQPIVAQATMVRRPRGLSTSMGVPLPAGLVPAPGPS